MTSPEHLHTDPATMTDEELQVAVAELEVGLTNTQPGSYEHTRIEAAIDAMVQEAERRATSA